MHEKRDGLEGACPLFCTENMNPDFGVWRSDSGFLVRDPTKRKKSGNVGRVRPIKNRRRISVVLNQVQKSIILLLLFEPEYGLGSSAKMSVQCGNVLEYKQVHVGSPGAVKLGPQPPLLVLPAEKKALRC